MNIEYWQCGTGTVLQQTTSTTSSKSSNNHTGTGIMHHHKNLPTKTNQEPLPRGPYLCGKTPSLKAFSLTSTCEVLTSHHVPLMHASRHVLQVLQLQYTCTMIGMGTSHSARALLLLLSFPVFFFFFLLRHVASSSKKFEPGGLNAAAKPSHVVGF